MKSLARNSFFNVLYKCTSVVFPLIMAAYVSRILSPVGVGKVASAQNIVTYFTLLAALGLPTYGTQRIAATKDREELIVKFSYMNECTDEHVYQFEKLSGVKKFVFVPKQFPFEDAIVIPGNESGQISNDTFYFKKYIDIYELVNSDSHKASELRYDGKCMIEHECLPG